MSNADVVRRYIDSINAHDWNAVATVAAPSLATAVRDGLWRGHSDLRLEVEWIGEHDNKVSVWSYGSATHDGTWTLPVSASEFAGRVLPTTGKRWRAPCAATYRVDNGRIVDVWGLWDWLGVLTQLDVVRLNES